MKTGRTRDLTHNPNCRYRSEFQLGGLCFWTSLVCVRKKQNKTGLFSAFIPGLFSTTEAVTALLSSDNRWANGFLSPDPRLSARCRRHTSAASAEISRLADYLFKTIFTEQQFSYLAEI